MLTPRKTPNVLLSLEFTILSVGVSTAVATAGTQTEGGCIFENGILEFRSVWCLISVVDSMAQPLSMAYCYNTPP